MTATYQTGIVIIVIVIIIIIISSSIGLLPGGVAFSCHAVTSRGDIDQM